MTVFTFKVMTNFICKAVTKFQQKYPSSSAETQDEFAYMLANRCYELFGKGMEQKNFVHFVNKMIINLLK